MGESRRKTVKELDAEVKGLRQELLRLKAVVEEMKNDRDKYLKGSVEK